MSVCSCGRYFDACSFCGREPAGLPPTRLERLAAAAGVDAWRLRSYLRARVNSAPARRLPVEVSAGNLGLAVQAWEAAGGDPLLALDVAISQRVQPTRTADAGLPASLVPGPNRAAPVSLAAASPEGGEDGR